MLGAAANVLVFEAERRCCRQDDASATSGSQQSADAPVVIRIAATIVSVSMTNLSQARHIISPVMCVPLLYSPSLAHLCRFRSRPGGIPRRPSPWSVIAGCARSCLPDLACPILPARSCLPDLACPILPARSCLKVPLTIGGEPGLKSGRLPVNSRYEPASSQGGWSNRSASERLAEFTEFYLAVRATMNATQQAGARRPRWPSAFAPSTLAVLYCPID